MRFRGILLTAVVVLAALVAALNWDALTRPVPISLLVATPQGPLALVLLLTIVALAVLFFLAALLDRAAQLRQVTTLDRQLAAVRSKLEARELEAADLQEGRFDAALADVKTQVNALKEGMDARIGAASTTLESRLVERFQALEAGLRDAMMAMETRDKERIDALHERVVRVRDELAADVAQSEDALARLVRPADREDEGA
jgi:mannitol-specific phosphotransferase system IIBC component